MDLKISGFTEADDEEFDPINIPMPWRSRETGEEGIEWFECKPRIPHGVLFDAESSVEGMGLLINRALRSDDGDPKEAQKPTSSLARWRALVNDEDREIPGPAISDMLGGLYSEYINRRGPLMGKRRPTKKDGRSPSSSFTNGRGSTGKPSGKDSTSDASSPTSD